MTRIQEFNELKEDMKELKLQVRILQGKLNEHEKGWMKEILEAEASNEL